MLPRSRSLLSGAPSAAMAAGRHKVGPADVQQALTEPERQARYSQLRQHIMTAHLLMAITRTCQQGWIVGPLPITVSRRSGGCWHRSVRGRAEAKAHGGELAP